MSRGPDPSVPDEEAAVASLALHDASSLQGDDSSSGSTSDKKQPNCKICEGPIDDFEESEDDMCFQCEHVINISKALELSRLDGSCSTESTTPRKPKAEEPAAEIVWANIERYLRTKTGPKPVVTCVICSEELIIPGLQEANGEREKPWVLRCGHVIGLGCIHQWISMRGGYVPHPGNPAQTPTCPYCREAIFDNVLPSPPITTRPPSTWVVLSESRDSVAEPQQGNAHTRPSSLSPGQSPGSSQRSGPRVPPTPTVAAATPPVTSTPTPGAAPTQTVTAPPAFTPRFATSTSQQQRVFAPPLPLPPQQTQRRPHVNPPPPSLQEPLRRLDYAVGGYHGGFPSAARQGGQVQQPPAPPTTGVSRM